MLVRNIPNNTLHSLFKMCLIRFKNVAKYTFKSSKKIYFFPYLILASPVATVEKIHKSSTNDLSIYGSSANRAPEVSRHGTVPPPGADRYPAVATLAGEQLLARSGFQPYRPDDR